MYTNHIHQPTFVQITGFYTHNDNIHTSFLPSHITKHMDHTPTLSQYYQSIHNTVHTPLTISRWPSRIQQRNSLIVTHMPIYHWPTNTPLIVTTTYDLHHCNIHAYLLILIDVTTTSQYHLHYNNTTHYTVILLFMTLTIIVHCMTQFINWNSHTYTRCILFPIHIETQLLSNINIHHTQSHQPTTHTTNTTHYN